MAAETVPCGTSRFTISASRAEETVDPDTRRTSLRRPMLNSTASATRLLRSMPHRNANAQVDRIHRQGGTIQPRYIHTHTRARARARRHNRSITSQSRDWASPMRSRCAATRATDAYRNRLHLRPCGRDATARGCLLLLVLVVGRMQAAV